MSSCPRCGYSNPAKYSTRGKTSAIKKVGAIAGISVIVVVAAFFLIQKIPLPTVSVSDQITTTEENLPTNDAGSITDSKENVEKVSEDDETSSSPSPLTQIFQPSKPPLDELRQHALQKINDDRAKFDLPPVQLSYNDAAQIHAENVFETKKISHWMTNGEKPYMTYSRYGGLGEVGQNVAVEGYAKDDAIQCSYGLAMCTHINPKGAIDRAEYDMMYNDKECCDEGHRDNILDKSHTHVSLGIMYDNYYFAYVQNFENQYVSWSQPIVYDENSKKVSMSGVLADGVTLDVINLFFDPLPTPATYEQHADDKSYGLGDIAAVVVEPPPPGSYYDEANEHVLVVSETWHIDDNSFEMTFPMDKVYAKYGSGVYTVVIFVNDGSEGFSVTNTSLFIK